MRLVFQWSVAWVAAVFCGTAVAQFFSSEVAKYTKVAREAKIQAE